MNTSEKNFTVPEPFVAFLGARWLELDERDHRVVLEMSPHLCNKWEVAHGGVLMTLLDVVMARVCRLADLKGRPAITIEMKSSFVRPGTGSLKALGQCIHSGQSTAFAEAKVIDEAEKIVAYATGTFKYVNPKKEI